MSLKAATLSWYGPAYDGGCPITNYRVEMCDAEDQEWTLVTSKCLVCSSSIFRHWNSSLVNAVQGQNHVSSGQGHCDSEVNVL